MHCQENAFVLHPDRRHMFLPEGAEMHGREHPYISILRSQLANRHINRRDFLRLATLLGLSAAAAYRYAGSAAFAQAASDLPKGGTLRIGMHVYPLKSPHQGEVVEASNVFRG